MNFVKYNQKNHIEIQPAALVLSGLDQAERLEMHTLDGALVLLKDDMDEFEQVHAITALSRLAEGLKRDVCARHFENAPNEGALCVEDTEDGGILVSIGGTDLFELSGSTLEELEECGLSVELLVNLLLDLMEDEDED